MSIISIVLVLIVLGFALWVIQSAPIPINPWIKTVIMGVIVIAVLIWVLNLLGFHTGIPVRLN